MNDTHRPVSFNPPALTEPKWGPLGFVTYKRTYSRWLDAEQRRERWNETVDRVVRFSLSLDPTMGPAEQQAEGDALYRAVHGLEGFVSGRTLWMGGSEFSYSEASSIANFNCSSHSIQSADDLHDLVYLLMSGTGGGPRLTRDVVDTFNRSHPIRGRTTLVTYEPYAYAGDGGPEHTRLEGDTLIVGDSRAGWSEVVSEFVAHLLAGRPRLHLDFNHIRPKGTRLKSFGGYASGPEPLIEGLKQIEKILAEARRRKRVTDLDLMDICCLIGRLVVAGGTRRSALMILGDTPEFAASKTGAWYVTHPWRSQANISVLHGEQPSRVVLDAIFNQLLEYGEPGFINGAEASRRRARFNGINPCAEILMANYGVCNLVELNLMAFVTGRTFDLHRASAVIRLLARHALRITNLRIQGMRGNWDQVQREDRLLGVGLTGVGDLIDATGVGEKQLGEWFAALRYAAQVEAKRYADHMGVPHPLLTTTIKPSGSLSLLPGVSSGLHAPYAPTFIRRIRISAVDAVAQTLAFMGVPVEDDAFNPGTQVFSFPVASKATRKSSELSAVEQLERYKAVMRHYVDHNASVTVVLAPEEKGAVVDWMEANWDSFVGVSFLKKDDNSYPQMPFEAIEREDYERLKAEMPDLTNFGAYLEGMEASNTAAELEADCVGGACPVR